MIFLCDSTDNHLASFAKSTAPCIISVLSRLLRRVLTAKESQLPVDSKDEVRLNLLHDTLFIEAENAGLGTDVFTRLLVEALHSGGLVGTDVFTTRSLIEVLVVMMELLFVWEEPSRNSEFLLELRIVRMLLNPPLPRIAPTSMSVWELPAGRIRYDNYRSQLDKPSCGEHETYRSSQ